MGRWRSDAQWWQRSPYMEDSVDNTQRDSLTLTVGDDPSVGDPRKPFQAYDDDKCQNSSTQYKGFRARFVTFALCKGEVVSQIMWEKRYFADTGTTYYLVRTPTPNLNCVSFFKDPANLQDKLGQYDDWPHSQTEGEKSPPCVMN
ncbi:MAG: hypothetical protein AB1898_17730 [Acidobacteriota bacterium]